MTDTSVTDSAARATAALDRLADLHPKLIDLGLERTFALLSRLGNPHHKLPPTIHVAGTNGKGSVIAMMRAMAEAAGLTVHVYASPHLCRFNERIRLAGSLIGEGALADLLEEIEEVNGDTPVTFFEVTTAAAMLAFSRVPADLLLLETGLGGALDSTNVLAGPAATVITPIARDHEHFLGSDIAGIAIQKAGIMRAGTPCLSAAQTGEAMAALDAEAERIGTAIHAMDRDMEWQGTSDGGLTLRLGSDTHSLPAPALRGDHQRANAALATAALATAMPDADVALMTAGLTTAQWPGRLQRLDDGALTALAGGHGIWIDGAHNVHGALALAAALPSIHSGGWHFICGALNTRPAEEFLKEIAPLAASIHCLTIPDQPAALEAAELVEAALPHFPAARAATSLAGAVQAIADGTVRPTAPIMICGSLYLAGHVLLENGTLPA